VALPDFYFPQTRYTNYSAEFFSGTVSGTGGKTLYYNANPGEIVNSHFWVIAQGTGLNDNDDIRVILDGNFVLIMTLIELHRVMSIPGNSLIFMERYEYGRFCRFSIRTGTPYFNSILINLYKTTVEVYDVSHYVGIGKY
jgi:hypothetical protein